MDLNLLKAKTLSVKSASLSFLPILIIYNYANKLGLELYDSNPDESFLIISNLFFLGWTIIYFLRFPNKVKRHNLNIYQGLLKNK